MNRAGAINAGTSVDVDVNIEGTRRTRDSHYAFTSAPVKIVYTP